MLLNVLTDQHSILGLDIYPLAKANRMASDHNHPFSKHQAAQAIYLQDLLGAYQ